MTVTQLNEYVKTLLDSDRVISSVYVKGEISNFKYQMSSGHIYMTLKDENSNLKAVMFRYEAVKLKFMPENGMKVIAFGRISSYTKEGQYQLYVDSLVPDGAGDLAIRFEQLKNKLEKEGLFDQSHKKPLPRFPNTVGVVTSPTGAAVRDIINVCTRRYPAAKLVLFPVAVQGEGAAEQMAGAIDFFSMTSYADVVIIGRGGGSAEDLWEFNDEQLARAIYRCSVPVISAVGHETDFTICDFVADLRAPTPSAAAEIAVPDSEELLNVFGNYESMLKKLLIGDLELIKNRFERLSGSYVFSDPMRLFESKNLICDNLAVRLDNALTSGLESKKAIFRECVSKLETLNPLSVLKRGYAVVYDGGGSVISGVGSAAPGDAITVRVSNGSIEAEVRKITEFK